MELDPQEMEKQAERKLTPGVRLGVCHPAYMETRVCAS